jgi:hypothetical protein
MSNWLTDDKYPELARVYIALEMSKNVAERCAAETPNRETSQSLLTLLEVTSMLLEEVISPRPRVTATSVQIVCSEAVM